MKLIRIHFMLLICGVLFCISSHGQFKRNEQLTPLLKKIIAQKKTTEVVSAILTVKDISKLRKNKNIQIVSEYKSTNTLVVRIPVAQLSFLLDKNEIIFADAYRTPKEELTTGSLDIALNKINLAHNNFPYINGDSVNVSIKEQRFDTTDIDIKGRSFESGVASDLQSSHAAIMATILAGAGNSSPFAKGVAWGARLTSSDYASLLPDDDQVYQQYQISVQNHSYGTGIENYYGADAASYDMNVWNNPTLVHVFSAGNSGTSASTSGVYSGIAGLANLTGSFKMAKNSITAGATDSFNVVAALSSKGPAFDGRVKPDLVAFGEDGSSGAAALVSGTAALIQHAYKTEHHNLPDAALVKAVLLNSADDINEKHVDYVSGFGSLNTFAAIQTIKENRFFEGTIKQDEIKTFPIKIPPGIARLKIMVSWTDTAAIPNVTKALVNDIDALLQLPATGENWQPWVLNPYPDKDSLLLPALRKKDTLNTVEQITLDNPQPGNYLVQLKGSRIETLQQSFAITYQLDTVNSFRWTYPTSRDVLTASGQNVIRWQTNISGNAAIEYSTDGIQWQLIDPNVTLADQYFKWNVPDTISTALLRMDLPSSQAVVSDTFVLSNLTDISVGFDCPDSFLLYWNKSGLNRYQLYRLGQKYLEPLQTVADSFMVFQKSQYPYLQYSVAPLINEKPGLRSFTINYTTQGVGCYVKTFFALLQNQNTAFLTAELGTLYNVVEVSFQKITRTGVQTLQTVSNPSALSLSFTDLQLMQGANVYRLQIKLINGSIIYSNTDLVYYFPSHPVLVYPNPARQNQPINIVAQDPGVYSVRIYDAGGRPVYRQMLNDIVQQFHTLRLSAGLYLVKIAGENNSKLFTQKLIVY